MWLTANDSTSALEDLLPQSEQGRILFTTRNRKLAMKLAPFDIIPIPDVDKTTAFQILRNNLGREDLLENNKIAAILLEQLVFLPLAITQASAYIIENNISLSDYLTLLQEQEQDAIQLLSEDFRDPGRYKDIQNPVITTWLISFKQIQHQNQLAADYLSFMACTNPRNIPLSLLPFQTTKKQRFDALGLLDAYSFTNSQDNADISLHRLVYIATRNWLKENGLFSHWVCRVADHMGSIFPNSDHTNRQLWRKYLPHALVLIQEDEFMKQHDRYIDLISKIADCLFSDGRFLEAENLYKELLEKEINGPDDASILSSAVRLAITYQNQGRWDEAGKLLVVVLEAYMTGLGTEHLDTLTIMANLASNYRGQGQWSDAEKLEVQVLEKYKIVLGAENPFTLTIMANLASTYRGQERWNDAEKLEVQVLETSKTVLGDKHPITLISMDNLASTYRNQGRLNEAEKLFIRVLETSKIVLGDEHPGTLNNIANLALTYQDQGRLNEAEKLFIQVLEISKIVLGAKHPATLRHMSNLANTWKSLGKFSDALALIEVCCQLSNGALGPDHPDTRKSSHTFFTGRTSINCVKMRRFHLHHLEVNNQSIYRTSKRGILRLQRWFSLPVRSISIHLIPRDDLGHIFCLKITPLS
jgi:tetratricopeptide (TPR) repeat protein